MTRREMSRFAVLMILSLIWIVALAALCAYTAATWGWPVLIVFIVGTAAGCIAMLRGIIWVSDQ